MRRALIISNLFPNAAEPIRGIFVAQETLALAARYALEVIAPLPYVPPFLRSRPSYAYHRAPSLDSWRGLPVHHPRYPVIPGMLRSAYGCLMQMGIGPLFRRRVAEFAPDFLVAHYVFPDGYAAVELGRQAGLPVLVKGRGSDVNVFTRGRLRRRLTLRTLARADQAVMVSEALRERLRGMGHSAQDVAVVRNGIDRERFQRRDRERCRTELHLAPEPFIFLFVGMLRPIKGLATLLAACRLLASELRRPFRMILLGDGELREELPLRIGEMGLGEIVELRGSVPHDEIPRWLGACDCLVLPSLVEGYPNILVETLACERPVIASRVGGIPEIVSEGANGLLVPPGDAEALAGAMTRLLEGFEARGFDAPALRRSWDDVAADMAALIEGMIARRAAR